MYNTKYAIDIIEMRKVLNDACYEFFKDEDIATAIYLRLISPIEKYVCNCEKITSLCCGYGIDESLYRIIDRENLERMAKREIALKLAETLEPFIEYTEHKNNYIMEYILRGRINIASRKTYVADKAESKEETC